MTLLSMMVLMFASSASRRTAVPLTRTVNAGLKEDEFIPGPAESEECVA